LRGAGRSQLARQDKDKPVLQPGMVPALSHWPIQIRLVPPTAPFLKGADLLVTADCAPFAYPNFHQDFLKGKVLMVGCPKFDDVQAYIQKFAEIFATSDIKSITVVVIEVPRCQGLPMIVQKAMTLAGKNIPHGAGNHQHKGRGLEKGKISSLRTAAEKRCGDFCLTDYWERMSKARQNQFTTMIFSASSRVVIP